MKMGNQQAHVVILVDPRSRAGFYSDIFVHHYDALATARSTGSADWLIYSGDPDMLRAFAAAYERAFPAGGYKYQAVAIATTTFHGTVRLSLERRDTVALATPSNRPAVGVYPKNISSVGQSVWDALMRTQRMVDNIAGQSDRAAWAIAVQLYFNKMVRLNKQPFDEDARQSYLPQHQHEAPIKQRGVQQIFLARSFVEQLHKNLRSRGFVSSAASSWALRDVLYANNKYNVALFKSLPTNRDIAADSIQQYLTTNEGFSPYGSMRNTVAYRLSDFGFLLVTTSDNPRRLEFNLILSFHRSFLEENFNLRKNTVNKDGLLRALRDYARDHLLSDADYQL